MKLEPFGDCDGEGTHAVRLEHGEQDAVGAFFDEDVNRYLGLSPEPSEMEKVN